MSNVCCGRWGDGIVMRMLILNSHVLLVGHGSDVESDKRLIEEEEVMNF